MSKKTYLRNKKRDGLSKIRAQVDQWGENVQEENLHDDENDDYDEDDDADEQEDDEQDDEGNLHGNDDGS